MRAAEDRAKPLQLKSLFTLAEDMIYRLPGISDLAVRKELQRAARQFCSDTAIMNYPIVIEAELDKYHYPLHPPISARISMVRDVTYRGRKVLKAHYQVSRRRADSISFSRGWLDSAVEWSGKDSIRIRVDVVLVPELGAEEYLSEFLDQWGDAIVSGAMARLAGTPGMAWSNPGLAQMEADRYRDLCADAAIERIGGIEEGDINSRNPESWLI